MFAQRIKNGFSLVEILIIIVILSILTVGSSLLYNNFQIDSRDTKRINDLFAISQALEHYRTKNGYYPQISQSDGGQWFCSSYGNFADNSAMVSALAPYFEDSQLPKDPINDATFQYRLDLSKDKNLYWLYAKLEKTPQTVYTITGTGSGDPKADGCSTTIQVDLLKRNQQ